MTTKQRNGQARNVLTRGQALSCILLPDTGPQAEAGWVKLREYVNAAVGDYTVQRSPGALILASMLNDVLYEGAPDAWEEFFAERVQRMVGQVNARRNPKPRVAKKRAAEGNKERVQAAYDELTPSQQRSAGKVKIIAAKTDLTADTVRGHLEALGLRKKKAGKKKAG